MTHAADGWHYAMLADAVLGIHVAIVAFVIGGLLVVLVGGPRGWSWVLTPWFRWLHIAAIGIVVAESWLGMICPLTVLEHWLRGRAGEASYTGSFIGHWLHELLYIEAPPEAFIAVYTLFFLAVVGAWWRWPPRRRQR